MGSVFFGIALSLQALTGFSMAMIMITMGIIIIIYTVLGGIEAVIWTEVVQAIIKTLGAVLILYLVISKMPGGIQHIIEIGKSDNNSVWAASILILLLPHSGHFALWFFYQSYQFWYRSNLCSAISCYYFPKSGGQIIVVMRETVHACIAFIFYYRFMSLRLLPDTS